MNAQLTYKPIVLWHFQPDGLNVVNGLIFLLLRFSALIILFQESISLRCKRSCLRLVKKLTGEFMRVNELYFLIEYKILKGFDCWRHERAQFNKSLENFIFWLNTKFSRDSFADVMSVHNLTNRFQVAVHLFSNRSQMTSKCGKNKRVAHEAQHLWCLLIMRIMYQNKTRHCQHPWPSCLTLLRTEFSKSSRSVTSCENEELSETIYREFSDFQETSLREVYGRRVRSPSHLG